MTCRRGELVFDYLAKGAKHREQAVADADVRTVVVSLRRHKGGGEISAGEFTAKDFRTWHATVLAAVGLAVSEHAAASATARKRAIARAVAEVAGYLGNTPAVPRASYIDPRVNQTLRIRHNDRPGAA